MEKIIKKQKMVHYDKGSDVLYFGVQNGIEEEFVEVAPGVSVELDEKKKVIGIEVMNASRILRSVMKIA
ncbi:MAG: hypothetical protein A3A96_03205 [Candidatus Zambryskibacteria bacterium RIFCSPLOWO2_01_FULL_39_39]|uniref:DUF2283 domain-containing protein n=1 Tax=Candidatus Zambryskibacteria bacterium RIFCSPLOWO2_01_FULL_39_39 TaxID=1802758 RepID=A0A1G2TWE2_9BACT|nr:MAG: hypothetical protein UT00_C0008G0019 [Parcubacteria group bacterium GW2011_GWA1_38_7]OHA87666.1 MAG: hypothetical protein A2644_02595 [Candidatus Zambryskibacteria bacterium RIFCSPHIGHO2_01_FULL_39_63]OHA94398.1 MAG: hypothetical protein A3B88_01720 [Candidatus Zambryskibacteria bacterium RIFCSPHIGHO2_02_FULL_39_19]OHA98790.1 MAG: hypothetical protein A3F20_00890 [Candidatus Zambryskibacteria bacterium RIFCSPHIGHO2_12_FULL_39_21]OHB01648.1 MAG: hypothetical protein A3A96_03205 [Candidat